MQSTKKKSHPLYYSLIPTEFKLDGGAMFGIIPKPLWEKKIPSDEQNRINMALRVLVIQTQERVILVDSGVGSYHSNDFKDRHGVNSIVSPLESLLEEYLGIKAEQVTDIIPSHLHFDHIGGFSKNESQPVFPNAQLHLHKQHYQYALSPNQRDSGSFQSRFFEPLISYYENKKKINWLSGEKGEILIDSKVDNRAEYTLRFLCSHGHTPFHIHPFDEKMIFMGDLVPTSAHISPVWVIGYDMQPMICPDERVAFYKFIQKKNLTMIYDHDLRSWGSRVELIEDSRGRKKYQATQLMNQSHPELQQILEDR